MHNKIILITLFSALLTTTACQKNPEIPQQYEPAKDTLTIYPDYKEVVIPPNIAPLNFQVSNEAEEIVAEICTDKQKLVLAADENKEVLFKPKDWKTLIRDSRKIEIHIFAKTERGWVRYPDFSMQIASEPIDRYVSYRLIEPGYELYRQMGLYQRDMESFEVKTIYENNRTQDTDDNHCVNCHNYQNYSSQKMLFHIRGAHGGTLICDQGKVEKKDLKNDSILGPAVYPSWHPTMNRIAFSTNMTGQSFHIQNKEKVEVVDSESDLIYYDADSQSIRNIIKTKNELETFPCWNPEGNKLYYCRAILPNMDSLSQNEVYTYFLQNYQQVKYDILSLDFDKKTETFSNPQVVVDCRGEGKSASVPRISPDGRYLLFTKGDYGQFHIWHKSSDLWVKDLKQGSCYPLTAANSTDVDSYHSWSSNGRWMVFSSRRDDGNYTRLYLAYFDKNGKAHKAFLLPQESPTENILLLKSYNVPELTKDALSNDANSLKEAIYKQEAQRINYKP